MGEPRQRAALGARAVRVSTLLLLLAGCGGRATSGFGGSETSDTDTDTGAGTLGATSGDGTNGSSTNSATMTASSGVGGNDGSNGSGDAVTSTTGRGGDNGLGVMGGLEHPAIVGEIDGEAVALGDLDGSIGVGALVGDGVWSTSASFRDASVYLWEEGDGAFGLLEVPQQGQGAALWICLAEVDTDADDSAGPPSLWTASSLSRLPNCSLDDAGPLDVELALAGNVVAMLQSEPLDWEFSGYGSHDGRAEFRFLQDDREQVVLSLDLGDESGVAFETEIQQSTMVVLTGRGAVACGGSGTLVEDGERFEVHIDRFGPFRTCPGAPVDGQLRGDFAAP